MSMDTSTQPEQDSVAVSIDEFTNDLMKFYEDGGTLKTLKDIPPDTMESIYSIAYNKFNAGQLDEANKIFQFLCLIDHYDARFFIGLGACRQRLHDYEMAAESYSFVTLVDVNNPVAPFHAGECYLQLGELEKAESAFFACGHLAAGRPEHAEMKARADHLLEVTRERRRQSDESYGDAEQSGAE